MLNNALVKQSIAEFLSERSIREPDGRPLYAYHARRGELDQIRDGLQASLEWGYSALADSPIAAGAFCLWGAEWWRRNHDGGPWKWEGILTALGAEDLAPGNSGYPTLTRIVERGLEEFWKVELLHTGLGRGFLVTLACQGGLPLQLVRAGQGTGKIRRFFRGVLQELALPGAERVEPRTIARMAAGVLPRSLRHEVVYELGGQLAAEIRATQQGLERLNIGDSDPVSVLDQQDPEWRKRLPLRLDDDVAKALLRNLIEDATDVAVREGERIRWGRWLRRRGGQWVLEAQAELPGRLRSESFRVRFGLDSDPTVPQIQLVLGISGLGGSTLALGRRRGSAPFDSGALYEIEKRGVARAPVRGEAAAAQVTLSLRAPGLRSTESGTDIEGGGPLSALPWVFSGLPPEFGADDVDAEYRGEGSVEVRESRALVVTVPGSRVEVNGDGTTELLGKLVEPVRDVWTITGSIEVADPEGEVFDVRMGREDAVTPPEYTVTGEEESLDRDPDPLLRTLTVHRYDSMERRQEVNGDRLEWKPAFPGARWSPWTSKSFGDGWLRVREDGRIRAVRKIRLLPAGARIELSVADHSDGAGYVRLLGFGEPATLRVELEENGDLTRLGGTADGNGIEFQIESETLANSANLRIHWSGGQRLRIHLPFPGRWFAFVGPDGAEIPDGERLVMSRLSGVKAMAFLSHPSTKPRLQAKYIGNDRPSETARGYTIESRLERHPRVMDLFRRDLSAFELSLEDWVRHRLDASIDPDARIELTLWDAAEPDRPGRKATLGRFDLEVSFDEDLEAVQVTRFSGRGVEPDELERIDVTAISLWVDDLDEELLESLPEMPGLWKCPPAFGLAIEEFLITAREGQLHRGRPLVWRPLNDSEERGYLPTPAKLAAMASSDPLHDVWIRVDAMIARIGDLPASCFPLLLGFRNEPDAIAMAAIAVQSLRSGAQWDAFEELGFLWQGIPIGAWSRALLTCIEAVEDGHVPAQVVEAAVEDLVSRLPGLRGMMPPFLAEGPRAPSRVSSRDEAEECRARVQQGWPAGRSLCAGSLRWCPTPTRLPELLERVDIENHADGITSGLISPNFKVDDEKYLIMNAPVLLAAAAVFGVPVTGTDSLTFRAVRQRNQGWFDQTWNDALTAMLSTQKRNRGDYATQR